MYVHLHNHSYYSMLEGLSSPAQLAAQAKAIGSPGCGLTDRGGMYGAVEFYKACKEVELSPVIGTEVYIAATNRFDMTQATGTRRFNTVLIAYNHTGYNNLLQLTTKSHVEGFYYKPRVDKDLLREYSEGLICLTSNIGGEIPQAILYGKPEEEVLELIREYQGIFGSENVFLELEHHPDVEGQDKVNEKLIEIGTRHNIPLIVANNTHYAKPEDQEAHEIILCMQTGKDYGDPSRFSMRAGDYSLRDWKELRGHFPENLESAFTNTIEVANRCHYNFEFGKNLIPSFKIPEDEGALSEEMYFRKLCWKGLIQRYDLPFDDSDISVLMAKKDGVTLEKSLGDTSPEELRQIAEASFTDEKIALLADLTPEQKECVDRLEYEMCVINEMGFCTYFLIVGDFCQWALDHGIAVGPGRGSAAGAIVAYVLRITDLDPLQYSLLFERFLNPARVSMPDIDIDFQDDRRNEVLEYVKDRYGALNVAQVATYGTLKAKQAVKDVGRSLGIPYQEMDLAAKKITEKLGTKLSEIIAHNPEIKELMQQEKYKKVFELALRIEGVVRQMGVHACATIISEKPLTEYTALQYPPKDKNMYVTQYNAKPLELLGLLKMDFLGLRNLTVMQIALKIIERLKNKSIDMSRLPLDDKETYALFGRGETKGVFQFESEGMRKWLKELKPDNIEDIIAMASMYRPGPLAWIPVYVAKKHKLKIQFPDENAKKNFESLTQLLDKYPEIKEILEPSNMIPIYQEQILQIAQRFSGFSLGAADLLRRAIGKKVLAELMAQKEKFIEGAVALGRSEQDAKFLFENGIEPFANYGFNKSHAACYAVIAYRTAYLKAHYPTEFMTALLSTVEDTPDKLSVQLADTVSMGIRILAPDVNESLVHFTAVRDGEIRFGLNAVKGLGIEVGKQIVRAREEHGSFQTLEDFLTLVPPQVINKKTLESLTLSGALDSFGYGRDKLYGNIDNMIAYTKAHGAQKSSGQTDIFAMMTEDAGAARAIVLRDTPEIPRAQLLKMEKDVLEFYVTGHPLQGMTAYIRKGAMLICDLTEKDLGKPRIFVGIITKIKRIMTKGGDLMATMVVEDICGEIGVVLFPKSYKQFGGMIREDMLLKITGKVELRNGELQCLIQEMKELRLETMIENAKAANCYDPDEIRLFKKSALLVQEVEEEVLPVPEISVKAPESDTSASTDEDSVDEPATDESLALERYDLIVHHTDAALLSEIKTLLEQAQKGPTRIILHVLSRQIETPYFVRLSDTLLQQLEALTTLPSTVA